MNKRREKFHQLRSDFAHFHHYHFGNAKGDLILAKQILHAVGVAYNDASDRRIRRL